MLPLSDATKTIAVSGPVATDAEVLLGNFYRGLSSRLVTVAEGIVEGAPDGTTVTYMPGCNLAQPNLFDSTWAFGLSEWAEVAVVVIGTTPLMEGENGECILSSSGGDRDFLGLPEVQLEYVRKLRLKLGDKKLVAVVTGGSPQVMPELHELADAILFAWYPGEQGGNAVADILFGKAQPGGRLPFTVPKSEADIPAYDDYSMKNRTYRYGCPEPLYPFGYGLQYGAVEYADIAVSESSLAAGAGCTVRCQVTNTGTRAIDEIVQLYIADEADAAAGGPEVNLKSFQKVALAAGASAEVVFEVTPEQLQRVNEAGEWISGTGSFTLTIAPCAPGARGAELGVSAGVSTKVTVA